MKRYDADMRIFLVYSDTSMTSEGWHYVVRCTVCRGRRLRGSRREGFIMLYRVL
jgi:hypothetical protein